jgi:small subunit ribosomal protein S8|uniref:Ribosomal protein S8 n=1 Tax=Thalassiosira profunda TaxID=376140 RepID=A0A7T3RAP5_9STRA|nr:ribosomal protein S8 [Thalassiosira profunda]QPZ94127.1 ribosomal protein S8 [Thalassiosira profunda]
MLNTLWNVSNNLKNSQISRRNFIFQQKTKLTIAFLNILWDEGFILGYKIDNVDSSLLKIFLKYKKGNPVIKSIKCVYTPSRNIHYSVAQLWKFDSKKSLVILTTSKGLLTAQECRKAQIGGKPLFIVK